MNYASEWLYSPIDEELENKLYFLDFDQKDDSEKRRLVKKKKKSTPKDDYSRVEDYFTDQLDKKLQEDLNSKGISTMKKYGLLMKEKI